MLVVMAKASALYSEPKASRAAIHRRNVGHAVVRRQHKIGRDERSATDRKALGRLEEDRNDIHVVIVQGAALNGVPGHRWPHRQRSFVVERRIDARGGREHDRESTTMRGSILTGRCMTLP